MPRPKILIVEDDEIIRSGLAERLNEEGFSVCTASDGQEALSLLQRIRAELVLLDLMMPTMGGEDFLRYKMEDSRMAKVPVVIVSSVADQARISRERQSGVVGFVKKPVDVSALLQLVDGFCSRPPMKLQKYFLR